MTAADQRKTAHLEMAVNEHGALTLTLSGRLDATTTANVWLKAQQLLERSVAKLLIINASGIEYCDGAGIGLLLELQRRQLAAGRSVEIVGLAEEYQQLLAQFTPEEFTKDAPAPPAPTRVFDEIGKTSLKLWEDFFLLLAYVGELSVALLHAATHPLRVRWKDVLLTVERAGANCLLIVSLVGFLMGLIMAFQSAVLMREFGVEIFVANLVGKLMVRELGPLMTAILLAGRTGSAFAAELGSMKINEELDALSTMGVDPLRFLVIPRVLGAVFVTPLLSIFATLCGIIGGAVVLLSFGYPLIAYLNQLIDGAGGITLADFFSGLVKAVVFGILVAAIGCLRGLQTETGASAVGQSATRAVVSGIVLIILADGVFAVLYYLLEI